MKLRTKLVFALSLPFLGFFAFGVTDVGQRELIARLPEFLIGQPPANVDHWKANDAYMGAALAMGLWLGPISSALPLRFGVMATRTAKISSKITSHPGR